jgi:branched-chain amino acid transport system substrate-binding protein
MNKNSKSVLAVVAASVLALGTVSVTNATAAVKEVTLAFQGPLSGGAAQAGKDELAGAQYALAEYMATKPAVKVKLIQVDDQGSGTQAAIVSPGVARNKAVIGVIGSAYSGASENSFPSYRAAGLTMVSPSASRVTLTKPGAPDSGFPIFHRVVANDKVQGPALARLAVKGVTSPAAYYVDDQSPYGEGLRDEALPTLKKLATIVGKDSLLPIAGGDYSAIAAKVKASKANTVVYFGYDIDAGAFVKSLRDSGYTGVFAVGDGAATDTFPTTAGKKAAEGARITQGDVPFDNIATAAQKAAFTKASGVKVAGGYVTNTINATNVFLTCIKAGKLTRPAIQNCVTSGKFPNFTGLGDISFTRYGDTVSPAPIGAYYVVDGNIVYKEIA